MPDRPKNTVLGSKTEMGILIWEKVFKKWPKSIVFVTIFKKFFRKQLTF